MGPRCFSCWSVSAGRLDLGSLAPRYPSCSWNAPASSAAHGNDVPGPAVEGLAKEVGDALVVALLRHTTQPAFTYVHKWCKGDTVIWANNRSMHAALGHDLNDGPV